jgi:hypothetical protein
MRGKRQVMDVANRLAGGLERMIAKPSGNIEAQDAPVFMVGAPRCGSTLTYQVLVTRFHFAYLTNMMNTLYSAPGLAHRLTSQGYSGTDGDGFTSKWGRVDGRSAPSEGGDFWAQWFPRRRTWPWQSVGELPRRDPSQLQTEIARISELQGGPFLSKNLYHSLRIKTLAEIFPKAIFIVVTRSLPDIAASLLEARERIYGETERWFSVMPKNSEDLLCRPPAEQVVEQVVRVYRNIENDLSQLDTGRWIEVSYERFCHAPEVEAKKIADQLAEFGVLLKPKHNLPETFDFSSKLATRPERDDILSISEMRMMTEYDQNGGTGQFLRMDQSCDD